MTKPESECPLCSHSESHLFDKDKQRSYLICELCSLVYVPRPELITPEKEFERYSAHENADHSEGYRKYLSAIADSVSLNLLPHSKGLDFGCGKTMLLEKILGERGHSVLSYDAYFHPLVEFQNHQYDFIILSEVIEHLRNPREDLQKLKNLLRPDGQLFIKTKLLPSENFGSWFYKRDITHIQFFSQISFGHLSRIFHLSQAKSIGEDLFLFRNNG